MVAEVACPSTTEELADLVRATDRISICGNDQHRAWRYDQQNHTAISTRELRGIVSIEPADQVVIVRAGTLVSELQEELGKINQTIPFAPFEECDDPTIGGALSLALPHRLEAQCGTWRDWTLGLTVVRPDGAIAKCGSCAVKNVAGYDVGRLFIGARGALGVVAEVILRTYPLKALPTPACEATNSGETPLWVQRVRLGDLEKLDGPGVIDPETATLWTALEIDATKPRFEHDWVLRRGDRTGGTGFSQSDAEPLAEAAATAALKLRAKDRFDPTRKFNPGALGE